MYMISTRSGIVTFNTKEEFTEWFNRGFNRFHVLGQLEEIEVIEPAPYAFEVWACYIGGRVEFFESEREAKDFIGEEDYVNIYKYTKEV